jgi:hypothetical protein
VVHAAAETAFVISFGYKENLESELAYRLQRIRELAQKGLVDPGMGTLSVQGKLLLEHVMRLTPPRNLAQGKKRVQLDIEKIFRPLDPSKFKNESISKLIRKGDPVAWNNFSRNLREGSLRDSIAVVPTKAIHQQNRNKRGRAFDRPRQNMVTLKPQQRTLKQIIMESQQNVGFAKAGWVRAYTELRGDRTPEWVQRHFPGKGIWEDGRRAENPYIAAYNQTSWGKRSDEAERIMNNSIRARTNAMRSYFETIGKMVSEGELTPFQLQQQTIAEQFQ